MQFRLKSPLQGAITCGKTNKKKNRNNFLMKCENCLFAFANIRHDNGKFQREIKA